MNNNRWNMFTIAFIVLRQQSYDHKFWDDQNTLIGKQKSRCITPKNNTNMFFDKSEVNPRG